MPQGAHCSGCARRVQLTDSGECPHGHLRSMLRDVREGVEPAVETPNAVSGPTTATSSERSDEFLSVVLGRAFVLVPVAAILAFALWTGYLQGVDTGMSTGGAVMISIVSLVATIGGAYVWWLMARRKR